MAEVTMYRTREQILQDMMAEYEVAIPDVWFGEDGTLFILCSVEAGQFENGFLANQLVLNDMFVQTASLQALRQRGQERGLELKEGTRSVGTVTFSGNGGTYIPIDSEVAYDPGGGLEILYFTTTVDGTVPNPGTPTAPVAADGGAGTLAAGTYEFGVTFLTPEGESVIGAVSNALVIAVNHLINLTAIPVGGAGTTGRSLYRRLNGGAWQKITDATLVAALANNVATTVTYNGGTLGGIPPATSTAEAITLAAEALAPGIEGNVIAGTIRDISRAPASLVSVTNKAAFAGGSDQEDTEEFRQRLLDFMQSPQTGSPKDIQGWAENVSGVESATVFTNDNLGVATNGHTTVRISGPGGTVPSAAVQDAVLAALNDQGLATITFHVAGFVADVTAVTVDVTTSGTFTLGDVTANVQQAITDYINGLSVGETLYLSGIVAAVKPLAGIADVTVTTPATNQTSTATHKRTPGVITVT